MKTVKYVLFSVVAVAIAVVFVVFSLQNNEQIQLHLFSYSSPLFPTSGYIMVTFFMGMVFAGIVFALSLFKMKASTMSLKKQIKKLERELVQLRNQPLDEVPQNRSVEVAKLIEKDEETAKTHYIQSP